jgi:hypothetical protein
MAGRAMPRRHRRWGERADPARLALALPDPAGSAAPASGARDRPGACLSDGTLAIFKGPPRLASFPPAA